MSTTIIVHTSASSAVRHGCQHGWHPIQVDATTWTREERELLAQSVKEQGGARYTRDEGAAWDVAPPTAEALRAHVAARLAEQLEERQWLATRTREWIEAQRVRPVLELNGLGSVLYTAPSGMAYVAAEALGVQVHDNLVDALGRRQEYDLALATRAREWIERQRASPVLDLHGSVLYAAPAGLERAVAEALGVQVHDDLVDALGRRQEYDLAQEAAQEAEAAEKAQREAAEREKRIQLGQILAELDASTAARYGEGLLPEQERDALLRRLLTPILDACGAAPLEGGQCRRWQPATELSAAGYAALVAARARAEQGVGADKVVVVAETAGWREADATDDAGDVDEDGEVELSTPAVRIVVRATICGVRVEAWRRVE